MLRPPARTELARSSREFQVRIHQLRLTNRISLALGARDGCWPRSRCRGFSRPGSSCRRRRRCSCRGWRGTGTARWYVVHTKARRQDGLIAGERREHIQILLGAADCRQPLIGGVTVDHRERIRAFGQYDLELGGTGKVEVSGLPPDEELPVGRISHRLGKDTAVWARSSHGISGEQIGVIREKGIQERILSTHRIHRDAPHPPEQFVVRPGDVHIAIRPESDVCNWWTAVHAYREGYSHVRGAVVAMVADIGASGGYDASASSRGVVDLARGGR